MLELAAIRGFKKQQKNCPYEKDSHRSDMKGVLRKLEEMNPAARYSLWSSMNNVQTEYLPKKLKE
jgi:tRNA(Ile)-lysidine synthase TilS/MesJ